jgi:hypothetical protein
MRSIAMLGVSAAGAALLAGGCGTTAHSRADAASLSFAAEDGLSPRVVRTQQQGCALPTSAPDPQAGFAQFSDYAWKLFIAVNWPVTAGQRGVADCARPLGSAGPTVWESYKTVDQIFLPGAADPGPWNSGGQDTELHFRAKAPPELPLEPAIKQAVGGWVIDQRGNPTYYHVAVNQTGYDYVRTNTYYNADVLNRATGIAFPDGALEVKGAWRIVEGAEAARYHTMAAQVMTFDSAGNPTGRYRPATLGLTGLHVVYKAPGFPQWTWATFEHVDNAPDAARPTGQWAYFSDRCTGPYCTPNTSPTRSGIPFGVANQITRLSPIRSAVAAANTRWQRTVAGTPFRNYRLIAPQWPSNPNNPGIPDGTPTPGTVANVVMESYIQPTSSCMDCHSTARVPNNLVKTNYSFIFLFAQSPSQGAR